MSQKAEGAHWKNRERFLVSSTGRLLGLTTPDFSKPHIFTKLRPERSQEEYERAIARQAKADAAKGMYGGTPGFLSLRKDYISVVSPDRKYLIRKAVGEWLSEEQGPDPPGEQPVYDSRGRIVAVHGQEGWSFHLTPDELDRGVEFDALYRQAHKDSPGQNADLAGGHGPKK